MDVLLYLVTNEQQAHFDRNLCWTQSHYLHLPEGWSCWYPLLPAAAAVGQPARLCTAATSPQCGPVELL